jgi:aldose 1-epimerase
MTSDLFDVPLGATASGGTVGLIRLANGPLRVGLTNYGARLLSIEAPDREGRLDHVLLGFDRLEMILKAGSFGAVLGRFANRIAGGRFTLDGVSYQLSVNDGANTLHGGKEAFSKRLWTLAQRTEISAVFTLESPDGDQGFPGRLAVTATYELTDNSLRLGLVATTDQATPVNLSAHPYFNLAGADALDVCDHLLQVDASHFLPTDAAQIPTGAVQPVAGTLFDFRQPTVLGTRIRADDPQLLFARGYDHCLVLDGPRGQLRRACRLIHPGTGRVLTIETDRDGLQVYTGNSLNGSLVGFGGTYRMTAGLALEAQSFPDAPNQPTFPSTILRPDATFSATILYRFSTIGENETGAAGPL